MVPGSSLIEHERLFDRLVERLATMGKTMETEDLVVIYANSLPPTEYRTWLQGQMSVLESISLLGFKGRVREEERRMKNVDSSNDETSSVTAHYGQHNTSGNSNHGNNDGSGNGHGT